MTSTVTKPCGSTKTKSGEPCRNKVKDEGLCYRHNKDAIRCRALTDSKTNCVNVVSRVGNRCPIHSIKCGALTDTGTNCINIVSKVGYKCIDHGGEEKVETERVCTVCNKMKSFEEFYTDRKAKYGIKERCKECIRAVVRPRRTEGTKKCSKCKKLKDVSQYSSRSHASDGLRPQCKECEKCVRDKINYPRQECGTKQCFTCKVVKDVKEFWSRKRHKDGLNSSCNICRITRQAENKSTLDQFLHEIFVRSKKDAGYRDLDFGICERDLVNLFNDQNGLCPGTDYKLQFKQNYDPENKDRIHLDNYFNISLDRIDNDIGYIKGNIQLVTMGYNQIKGSLKEEFLFDICQKISKFKSDSVKPKKVSIDSIAEKFIRKKLRISRYSCKFKAKTINVDVTDKQLFDMYNNQGGLCSKSGIKMETNTDTRLRPKLGRSIYLEDNYFNISIDRINSWNDYVITNIQLVCSCINIMKKDMQDDLFIQFCIDISKAHQ
uniref:Uncharacterized protein n=1 Tax=Pithovirus LCPAC406 TaxID=2506599 RepID=A0A481ZDP7_9VIRU|nr:MAG: uncharacterized protein LCPAC406_03420 [Pithovirus LCPAC406]